MDRSHESHRGAGGEVAPPWFSEPHLFLFVPFLVWDDAIVTIGTQHICHRKPLLREEGNNITSLPFWEIRRVREMSQRRFIYGWKRWYSFKMIEKTNERFNYSVRNRAYIVCFIVCVCVGGGDSTVQNSMKRSPVWDDHHGGPAGYWVSVAALVKSVWPDVRCSLSTWTSHDPALSVVGVNPRGILTEVCKVTHRGYFLWFRACQAVLGGHHPVKLVKHGRRMLQTDTPYHSWSFSYRMRS